MISVTEALQKIDRHSRPLGMQSLPLRESLGSILATPVIAPIDMPPFRQSAMDGYAIKLGESNTYRLTGESKAGSEQLSVLKEGEAIRIFTGAPVPEGADTVVMQEHVTKDADQIYLDKKPVLNANVRPQGEQLKQGSKVLETGTRIDEAIIGFLAGLGIEAVTVYRKPKVHILTTGDELQPPGAPLQPGKIYESNGLMLEMAVKRLGIEAVVGRIPDDLQATTDQISESLKLADVVLLSGGISVGDYDFVREALQQNEVEELFYKVNQKPGKPLWFGKKDDKLVFALPGNPASSLSCFYIYVLPALRAILGFEQPHLPKGTAKLTAGFKNTFGKTLFLKSVVSDGNALILKGQASSMLSAFATANALVLIPEDQQELEAGEEVNYIKLRY